MVARISSIVLNLLLESFTVEARRRALRAALPVMSNSGYRPKRVFTIEQANACLPLVRSIVADMIGLAREMIERRQRLDQLTAGRGSAVMRADLYSEELEQIEEELAKDTDKLRGYASELLQLGVEPKGAAEGLVDFPCMLDGKLVYLCWKYNEPELLYWHELDAGFAGRRSLPAGAYVGSCLSSEHLAGE